LKVSSRDAVRVFKALSDVTRVEIVKLLGKAPRNVTELTSLVSVSQPKVSRHLKILRDAGLLRDVRKGKWVWYELAVPQKGEPTIVALSAINSLFSGKEFPGSSVGSTGASEETSEARGRKMAAGERVARRAEPGAERHRGAAGGGERDRRASSGVGAGRKAGPGVLVRPRVVVGGEAAPDAESGRRAPSEAAASREAKPGAEVNGKRAPDGDRSRRASGEVSADPGARSGRGRAKGKPPRKRGVAVEREISKKKELEDFLL
jgi:ArsR family transcriptional regulator